MKSALKNLDVELALISQNRRLKSRPVTISLSNLSQAALDLLKLRTKRDTSEIVEMALAQMLTGVSHE